MQQDTPTQEVAPRRRWRRPLVLAAAALALLLAIAVALGPLLVSAFGRGYVEEGFARRYQGRLELDALDLAWTGRQRVEGARLLDPDGVEVGRATLELPGLWAMITGRGRRLGRIAVVADAELVADETGVTNLDRALAPRAREAKASEPRAPDGGEPPRPRGEERGGLEALERLQLELDLEVGRLSWSDVAARAAGGPIVVEGLEAHLALEPGGPIVARATGTLSGSASGTLELDARVERPFAAASAPEPPRVEIDARLSELPVPLIDNLARQGGLLTALLGRSLTLALRASGDPHVGDAELSLEAPLLRVAARAGLRDGVLRAREGWALEAALDLEPETLERLLAPRLPADLSLARVDQQAPLRVAVARLSVPVAAALDARAEGEDVLATLLAGSELGLDLALGGWAVTAPQQLGRTEPLTLEDLALELRLVPTGGVSRGDLGLRARLAEASAGNVSLSASAPDVLALLRSARGEGEGRAQARLELRGLPTSLIESAAGVDGLLEPDLGPVLDATLDLDGALAAGGGLNGRLELDLDTRSGRLGARVDGALAAPGAPRSIDARGELHGLAAAYSFLPEPRRGQLAALLGQTLAFDVRVLAADADVTAVEAQVTAARLQLALHGELSEEALRLHGEPGLALAVRPSAALLTELLGDSLPAGASLELAEEGAAIALSVRTFDLPRLPAEAGVEAGPAALLERARGEVELTLPALVWRQPPAAAGGTPVPVELSGLRALVTLAPVVGLTAHLSGAVSGQAAAGVDVRLSAPRPAELLTEGPPSEPLEVEGRAAGLPTALVDALAGQDGLLVDVLGPAIDLELAGRWPDDDEPLRLQLRSPGASLELVASLHDGLLVAGEGQGLKASTPLSPLYSERVVGRLVPLAVGLSKPEGAPPVGIAVEEFSLPLDGDLRRLDATVQLDLNQVSYKLLPGLRRLTAAAGAERVVSLPPITLAIEQGVVRYDRLPLEVGGQSLVFRGAFDLATLELDLTTEVPLSALGARVSAELERVRDLIDPATPVPIKLGGTWKKPRVSIGKEFLETALKQAAEGALQRGLRDLLDRGKKDG